MKHLMPGLSADGEFRLVNFHTPVADLGFF